MYSQLLCVKCEREHINYSLERYIYSFFKLYINFKVSFMWSAEVRQSTQEHRTCVKINKNYISTSISGVFYCRDKIPEKKKTKTIRYLFWLRV